MQLSPYTQYYIRKLLRQYLSYIHYPLTGVGVCNFFQTDLNQLLKQLYSKGFEYGIKIQELETLIHLHQASEPQKIYPYETLSEIEQKIFWILGLKFLAILPSMPLTVVSEASAALFHFVLNGQLHQGIRHADELYGMVLEFGAVRLSETESSQNLEAYRLLLELTDQSIPFILTVSEFRHGIWVSLRAPSYHTLFKQNTPILKKIA